MIEALTDPTLPPGIAARFVDNGNGLRMHLLEAGHATPGRPCLLLLHGFPELAYSWRHVMPALAEAGYHVVAPDQRGYGRTTGWDGDYDGELGQFRPFNLVRDTLGLVDALGYSRVQVVGHDFGASVAAWCALLRPDIFTSLTLMSAPFAGPPKLRPTPPARDIHADLAALPRPRKHYQWYYSTRQANADMHHPPQGLHAFLRGYYHHKSADWPGNQPHPLTGWTAAELAKLPTYYVMDHESDMPRTVAAEMPTPTQIAANTWLTEAELAIYTAEYTRTGFQGGLQWYRARTTGRFEAEHQIFAGQTITVPTRFIAGAQDWGIHQTPGALNHMHDQHLIPGAGHWVQQEQPAAVVQLLVPFLAGRK